MSYVLAILRTGIKDYWHIRTCCSITVKIIIFVTDKRMSAVTWKPSNLIASGCCKFWFLWNLWKSLWRVTRQVCWSSKSVLRFFIKVLKCTNSRSLSVFVVVSQSILIDESVLPLEWVLEISLLNCTVRNTWVCHLFTEICYFPRAVGHQEHFFLNQGSHWMQEYVKKFLENCMNSPKVQSWLSTGCIQTV